MLVLGTGQELIQLEAARVLSLLLLGRGSVLLHGGRCLLLLLLHLLVTAAAEHASHGVAKSVTLEREELLDHLQTASLDLKDVKVHSTYDSRSDSDTSSGHSHLGHQTRSLGWSSSRGHCRGLSSHRSRLGLLRSSPLLDRGSGPSRSRPKREREGY